MKKILPFIQVVSMLFLFSNLHAQDTIKKIAPEPHAKGIQSSLFFGVAGGHVKGKSPGNGTVGFYGPSLHFSIHLGYTIKSWGFGVASGFNSLDLQSVRVNGSPSSKNGAISVDSYLYGFYAKKYFWHTNFFFGLEGGAGRIIVTYDDGSEGATDLGLAGNARFGKEFLLGAKKKFGLGLYINLSGVRCHDQRPNQKDVYNYLGPGIGISASFN